MFYGVYFYEVYEYNCSKTFLAGFYTNLIDAKKRLANILPDYKRHLKNTVSSGNKIGWINHYEFGDIDFDLYNGLNVAQPRSSIYLFNNNDNDNDNNN